MIDSNRLPPGDIDRSYARGDTDELPKDFSHITPTYRWGLYCRFPGAHGRRPFVRWQGGGRDQYLWRDSHRVYLLTYAVIGPHQTGKSPTGVGPLQRKNTITS